jgi:DinB superfamily
VNKEQLLALVEEGFQKAAWHGPNLRSALRGVTPEEALWRPAKGRHNIWEIVVHAAFWKYTVTRRLTGGRKQDFPEKGRNWFVRNGAQVTNGQAIEHWKSDLALLTKSHQKLCDAIRGLKESELMRSTRVNRQTALRNIVGVAMHDVYHAGQIQLLRKLFDEAPK